MDCVAGHNGLGLVVIVAAGVEVSVEPREVAARDVEPDPMTCFEQVGCGPEIDGVLVDPARLDGLGLLR